MINFTKPLLASLMIASISLVGCATIKDAPISNKITSIDTSQESIAFMTLKVANQKNTSYQPNIKYAFVWDDKPTGRKKYSFKVIDPISKVDKQYNEYVVSFKVQQGDYVLRELFGQSGLFPVIGTFGVPMFKKVSIPANQVIYLGHVDATIVDRTNDDQLRAGPIIPLIDQAVVGASNGTFRIQIEDRYDTDTSYIKNTYPMFSSANIQNMTMSPWTQPTADDMK